MNPLKAPSKALRNGMTFIPAMFALAAAAVALTSQANLFDLSFVSVAAFAPPVATSIRRINRPSISGIGGISTASTSLSSTRRRSPLECNNDLTRNENIFEPPISFTRPIIAAATSAFLATSLLFSNPVLPPLEAHAATTTSSVSPIATSIDIDLRGVPSLTRKAIINREAISNYVIEAAKSIQPILRLLSESDTVTVRPPEDVKGAIKSLAGGEAQLVINGNNLVDVRVESVPGVIVVRIINPNIPRLPFLQDGTAALKFVDELVDVAPAELEKAAEEVQAIENFLTWGAPERAPIRFQGTSLDLFLKSKFLWDGKTVSLGSALGDLTNSEVILGLMGAGIVGTYSLSYSYYVYLREEAEREASEKKAKAEASKKAKAGAVKKEARAMKDGAKETPVATAKVESEEKPQEEVVVAKESYVEEAVETSTGGDDESKPSATDTSSPKRSAKDAIKGFFQRGNDS